MSPLGTLMKFEMHPQGSHGECMGNPWKTNMEPI